MHLLDAVGGERLDRSQQETRCSSGLLDCEFFGVGQVVANRRWDNHREDLYRYVVRRRMDLLETIIPFFERYPMLSSKQHDFEKFAQCVHLISAGRHLTTDGS